MEKGKIITIGPAYPYRGGIAAFNERLSREFVARGADVSVRTFTLQYPSFLFPGKTQFSTDPAPEGLEIVRSINSINPLSWIRTGIEVARMRPDMVIIQYWLPYMAPALGTIARIVRWFSKAKVTAVLHNMIPHEHKPGDRLFSRYFCGSVDSFAALSDSVLKDVDQFDSKKPRVLNPHPLYDNFGQIENRDDACRHLGLDPSFRYLLFFGLIRDYKGLDLLIEALADKGLDKRDDYRLIVAGEFYSHPEKYLDLAKAKGVEKHIIWRTEYVPDSEVRYYFSAAEMMVLPYRSATQSGVTQIAYHFEKPMLITDVGGLGETVPDGVAGYVTAPEPASIAEGIRRQLEDPKDFTEGIRAAKKRYSWSALCDAIESL